MEDAVLNIGEHCLNHQLTSSCQLSQDSYGLSSLHICSTTSDFVPVRWRIVKIHTAHIHSADNSPDMGTECGTEPQ